MDQVEEIKSRLDIVEFIRQYLDLKKSGVNFSAPCPFHNEKTPSFMVSPERQSFRCFGCGEGGDLITFFQKIEGLSFPEALKILAERTGIKLEFSKTESSQQKSDKQLIYTINILAAKYFKHMINQEVGNLAMKYLKDRGLSNATIEKLKIGFAPANNRLEQLFKQKNFNFSDLSKAGHPERFRYRIMFPIFDNFGSIVGFSGRILEAGRPQNIAEHPKYLNTPETAVFHKSKAIYGINFAKEAIRKNKQVIIVEGQMDVALAHESGFEEVVASSGTALTQEHLKSLSRLTENILFCFDEDEAGQKAAISAVELSLEMGLDPKLIKIKGAKDVGELALKDPKALGEAFSSALPPVEWLARKYADQKPLAVSDKKKFVAEASRFILRMKNEVEKAHYVSFMAKFIGVAEIAIERALSQVKLIDKAKIEEKAETKASPTDLYLAYLINFQDRLKGTRLSDIDFDDLSYSAIYKTLQSCYNNEQPGETVQQIKQKISREIRERLDAVSLELDHKLTEDASVWRQQFDEIKAQLELRGKEKIKNDFARKIADAESRDDIEEVRRLMKDLQKRL